MDKKIMEIEELLPSAEKRFWEMAGMEPYTEAGENIGKTVKKLSERIFSSCQVLYTLESFPVEENAQGRLEFCGYSFSADFLEQGEKKKIKRAAVYMITLSGTESAETLNPLEQVCYDLFGTGLIDCAMVKLREEMSHQGRYHVSPAMGPGYYGLPIGDVIELYRISEGEKLGVTLSSSGLMLPEKSRTGFCILSEERLTMASQCIQCNGQEQSCRICNVLREQEGR